MQKIVSNIAQQLVSKQQMLAVAESCTGGGLAKVCTDLPGSSQWFDCGWVTYSNEAKMQMLEVSENTLAEYGAVSEQTVQEMVCGVLQYSAADWEIAVSGMAGPGGGSSVNPVGSVWFAWLQKDSIPTTSKMLFTGGREEVRQQSVEFALKELNKLLT